MDPVKNTIRCTHCSTPFIPKADETYCCHGCYYVAQLIQENGLEQFYDLKGNAAIPPVGSKVFQTEDTEPLTAALAAAETTTDQNPSSLRLSIEGISCIGCVWLIETLYKRQPGARSISINSQNGTIELCWQHGTFDIVAFSRELQSIGYRIAPYSENPSDSPQSSSQLNHRIGLCGFFLLNTMLFTLPGYLGMAEDFFLTSLFRLLSALFATLSLIVGGGYFINRAWQAVKLRTLHIDLPIAIGLLAAYAGSLIGFFSRYERLIYFDFVATFVFLMLCGRWLQEYALEKNRSQLKRKQVGPSEVICDDSSQLPVKSSATKPTARGQSCPPGSQLPVKRSATKPTARGQSCPPGSQLPVKRSATKPTARGQSCPPGSRLPVERSATKPTARGQSCPPGSRLPVERIAADLIYSVPPGKINPVAADLLDTEGLLSLEWINGEPEPVTWRSERTVPAGAINVGLNPLRFRARESWADSLLAKLLESSETTFNDRNLQTILRRYIAGVLVIAIAGEAAWLLATSDPLKALQVFISILIVSCPCALGVALPLCNELVTSSLRRTGLFVKSALLWERLRRVKTVVFDKTGTLTLDIPQLKNSECIRKLEDSHIRALYQLVTSNYHPVARALREALLAHYPKILQSHDQALEGAIEEIIGKGILQKDPEGNQWSLGAPEWLSEDSEVPTGARSVFRKNGSLIAAFEFIEDVRDEARTSIAALRNRGLQIAILSGDAPERVDAIARQLHIPPDAVRAHCSPEDKAEWIERHAPESALMLGDGANDRLAFDRAVCRGTPVVDRSILESSADFFFFGRSLRCLPQLFAVAAKRRQTVLIIFAFAVCYNLAAIGLCLAGNMHPLMAAILMPLSSIATLLIAWLRLKETRYS